MKKHNNWKCSAFALLWFAAIVWLAWPYPAPAADSGMALKPIIRYHKPTAMDKFVNKKLLEFDMDKQLPELFTTGK